MFRPKNGVCLLDKPSMISNKTGVFFSITTSVHHKSFGWHEIVGPKLT